MLNISFHLLPGLVPAPPNSLDPFPDSIYIPLLEDDAEVDVTDSFRKEGVDIEGLILLSNGRWNEKRFIAPKAGGGEETMSQQEMEARWRKYLGPFATEVTLAGSHRSIKGIDETEDRRVGPHAECQCQHRDAGEASVFSSMRNP